MNYKEISTLLVRVAGIIIVATSVLSIPDNVASYLLLNKESTSVQIISVYVLPILLPLIAGFILWLYPQRLSNKMIKVSSDDFIEHDFNHSFEKILVSILGLYLLFNAISDLIFNVSNYFIMRATIEGDFPLAAYNYPVLIATFVELFVAIWFIFRSKSIVSFINK